MSDAKESTFKQVEKLELRAKDFGFYWETIGQLLDQIRSECNEIQEAWEKGDAAHLQEEVGDAIHATLSLAVFCKLDPEHTLQKSLEKFERRYDAVVKMAQSEGHDDLHGQPFEVLMHYWNRAKSRPV